MRAASFLFAGHFEQLALGIISHLANPNINGSSSVSGPWGYRGCQACLSLCHGSFSRKGEKLIEDAVYEAEHNAVVREDLTQEVRRTILFFRMALGPRPSRSTMRTYGQSSIKQTECMSRVPASIQEIFYAIKETPGSSIKAVSDWGLAASREVPEKARTEARVVWYVRA